MSRSDSHAALRVLAGVVALPLTALVLPILVKQLQTGFDPLGAAIGSILATLALLCWWFALRGHLAESRARMRITVLGGLLLGAIGFVAGFFGPIILTPESNQGPLLGIFFTGPLGFVAGCAVGRLYARSRLPRLTGGEAGP